MEIRLPTDDEPGPFIAGYQRCDCQRCTSCPVCHGTGFIPCPVVVDDEADLPIEWTKRPYLVIDETHPEYPAGRQGYVGSVEAAAESDIPATGPQG